MRIIEYLTPISNRPEDVKLDIFNSKVYSIFKAYASSFSIASQLRDLEREHHIKDIEIKTAQALSGINRTYRADILNVSPDYKRENLTVWSFAGKMLVDVVGKDNNFTFNKRNYKERTKLHCTPLKLRETVITALAFLLSKYKNIYKFHIYATILKVAFDFFDYESLMQCDLINEYVQVLETDIDIIITKSREIGLTPAVKIKKTRQKKDKVELPPKEYFEQWLSSGEYTVTQLKDIIAKQYNISAKTVQRKLSEYGLTRKYNNNK